MTKQTLIHNGTPVQPVAFPEHAASWLQYFRQMRVEYVERYRTARYWPDRRSARGNVLHYGRLIRKMERRGVTA